jgi:small subunit ribosomal protein S6
MHPYELVLIIHPDLDEAAITGILDKVKTWITDSGGSIDNIERWGKRQMAYTIKKQREGMYILLTLKMAPTFSSELERNLKFLEPVMRFMITAQ